MHRVLRSLRLWAFALALAFAPAVTAADPPATKGIKWAPLSRVPRPEGKPIYDVYCVACHGPTGRGNGPAAPHLPVPVPDLTKIAERDGKFSLLAVEHRIGDPRPSGSLMPDWGELLLSSYSGDRSKLALALFNLTLHIERMQVQSASR